MARLRKQSSLILTVALVAIFILGIFGFVSLAKRVDNLEPTKTVRSSAYARGLLDDETGKLPSEDIDYSGIHMKEFISVDGLKCELSEDAKIKYQINFFDEDYAFIGVTARLISDYDAAEDEELLSGGDYAGAKFALIEIIPTADADGVVTSTEVSKYAKQLTVTYNK